MLVYYKKLRFFIGFCLVLATLMTFFTGLLGGPSPAWTEPMDNRTVIVLDPGHGGNDKGAKRPEGGFEKDLVLYLAKRIGEQLGSGYRIVLTRKDDYAVDLDARTGMANHLHADLFLSLHAHAGFRPLSEEVRIFCYRDAEDSRLSREDPSAESAWKRRHSGQLQASRAFAAEIGKQLNISFPGIAVRIEEAPLAVLAGAGMPAVLIEAGGFAFYTGGNPQNATRVANAYIQGITNAIAAFCSKRGR
jgi:N-acetylmuramoyl-L-alanine amidase